MDVGVLDLRVRVAARIRRRQRLLAQGNPPDATQQLPPQTAQLEPQPRRGDSTRTGEGAGGGWGWGGVGV